MEDPMASREPFGGKMCGIWNVEIGDGEPVLLASDREMLERELTRRRALDSEDDDHMTEFHHVFSCDVMGAWWNSHEPDPREDEPLTNAEILSVQEGDI